MLEHIEFFFLQTLPFPWKRIDYIHLLQRYIFLAFLVITKLEHIGFRKVYLISFDFKRMVAWWRLPCRYSISYVWMWIAIAFTICTFSQSATHTSENDTII